MKEKRMLPLAAAMALLAGCGEDAGGGSTPTPTPTPTGPATLAVTLTPATQSATASEDNGETTLSFTAAQVGTTSDPVVADLQYDKTLLTLQGDVTNNGGQYNATFKTAKDLSAASYKGNVTFRLCRDASCAVVYPGSTQTFAYTVDVKLKEWEALQRNAGHTGYVHGTFQTTAFKKAWEYTPTFTTNVSAVASSAGTIYLTRTNQDGTTSVHALDSAAGAEKWGYTLSKVYSASAPAVGNGQVYVSSMVMSSDRNQNVVLDAKTGKLVQSLPFAAQWSYFAPPTPYAGDLFTASGYYGNTLYAYDVANATTRWTATGSGGNIWDGETPAVDDNYVYYYSGAALDVFDRHTGVRVRSIADPSFAWGGYTGRGAPVLGTKQDVISYEGAFTGAFGANVSSAPIVSYSLATGKSAWRSSDVYATLPAVAKGVVYIARNSPMRLDALNEDTGAILWSWTPPAGEMLRGNVIATDNLVFVSTDAKVYAISLADAGHATAWTGDTPGELAITGDGLLTVSVRQGQVYQGSRIIAYSLK